LVDREGNNRVTASWKLYERIIDIWN